MREIVPFISDRWTFMAGFDLYSMARNWLGSEGRIETWQVKRKTGHHLAYTAELHYNDTSRERRKRVVTDQGPGVHVPAGLHLPIQRGT